MHSELLKATILKDFVEFYGPSKFFNVTNGSKFNHGVGLYFNISRACKLPLVVGWIRYAIYSDNDTQILIPDLQCNPGLSNLIHETLRIPKGEFLKDLYKLEVCIIE